MGVIQISELRGEDQAIKRLIAAIVYDGHPERGLGPHE